MVNRGADPGVSVLVLPVSPFTFPAAEFPPFVAGGRVHKNGFVAVAAVESIRRRGSRRAEAYSLSRNGRIWHEPQFFEPGANAFPGQIVFQFQTSQTPAGLKLLEYFGPEFIEPTARLTSLDRH